MGNSNLLLQLVNGLVLFHNRTHGHTFLVPREVSIILKRLLTPKKDRPQPTLSLTYTQLAHGCAELSIGPISAELNGETIIWTDAKDEVIATEIAYFDDVRYIFSEHQITGVFGKYVGKRRFSAIEFKTKVPPYINTVSTSTCLLVDREGKTLKVA